MCHLFLEQARADIDFLQEAVAAGEAEALRMRAHRLKGAAFTFGADQLGDLAAELEQLGRQAEIDAAGVLSSQLPSLFEQTLSEMRRVEPSIVGISA
jgi:HPt (histidine-containing phosphotransfer) domain-containing protein